MIRLHSTGLNDATILSNIFIDRFMPKANGEFVKVYIYLLRMLGRPEEAFGLSQMADSLFCTEGDILRALKYWESEKLITLLYEEAELTGITLQAPWNEADMLATVTPAGICNAGSLGDVPDTYHVSASESPASIPNAPTDNPLQTDQISYRSADLPVTPSSKPLSETKALTPDRVKELKQNEDIIQLLYIAEQYLGKTLTPTETRKILFFYDELHMSVDLIDYLIEYCVGRDHRSIRYIETVAMAWKEEGITTVEMAKDSTSRYSKEYFSVLKALYLHCLPADITGVSCETGEVDASVFDRYRIPLYKEASFKPYVIAAMIMLSKFENPQDILKKLEVKAAPRIME